MGRWRIPALALGTCAAIAALTRAQLPQAPSYKYPVVPQAGTWMICVKSYKGEHAKDMAEELAEYIRTEYKVRAYLFERGVKERAEEEKRIADLRKQYHDLITKMGAAENVGKLRYRTLNIEDEFAVLVGGWPDIDTARKALEELRRMSKDKPPPDKLLDRVLTATPDDADTKKGFDLGSAALNPFRNAMVAPNPTAPKQDIRDDQPDPILKQLNSGNKYSPLGNRKDWTLVVKVYQGTTQIASSGSVLSKIFGGNKAGEVLNASALQAEQLAYILRNIKEMPLEAYVLHTRYQSIVTVGQFESEKDPKIADAISMLAKLRLDATTADPTAAFFLQLNPQPLPMKIPR